MSASQVVYEGCKLCSKCGKAKPVEDFSPNAKRSSGYSGQCKQCHRSLPSQQGPARRRVSREWYRRNGPARSRQALYGLSPEMYDEMLKRQGDVCAICGNPETRTYRGHPVSLAVDHCHETNEIRGLLCGNCNVAIGMLRHDVALLDKARNYLEGKR